MEDWRVDDLLDDGRLERDLNDDGVYDDGEWPGEHEGLPELIFTEGCEEDGVELGPCISLQRCSNGRMSATAAGPSGEVDAVRVMLLGVSDSGRPSVGIDLGYACTQQAQNASHRASLDGSALSGDASRSSRSSSSLHDSPNLAGPAAAATRSSPLAPSLAAASPPRDGRAATGASTSWAGSHGAGGASGFAAGGATGHLDFSGRHSTGGDDVRAAAGSAASFTFGGGFGGFGAGGGGGVAAGGGGPAPLVSPSALSSPSPPSAARNRHGALGLGASPQQRSSPGTRPSPPSPFVFQPPRTPSKQVLPRPAAVICPCPRPPRTQPPLPQPLCHPTTGVPFDERAYFACACKVLHARFCVCACVCVCVRACVRS
jgi:hypothetical protein